MKSSRSTPLNLYKERDVAVMFADIEPLISREPLEQPFPSIDLPQNPFEAAVDCGVLLSGELLDLCQRNVNASFGLLRRLISASTPAEFGSVQADHLNKWFAAVVRQNEEFLTFSAYLTRRMIESATNLGLSRTD